MTWFYEIRSSSNAVLKRDGRFARGRLLPRAGRRLDFERRNQTVGLINAQPFEARLWRLCARVVDADIALERGVRERVSETECTVAY